jgi:hypothetical protein
MVNVMPKVREVAKTALDNAPPTARFAVLKFNQLGVDEVMRPIQDFTNDLRLVKGGIDVVDVDPNAPTCLYNALYQTIELLDNTVTQPQERRAIILFTDGKDDDGSGQPCSQRTYDDVIYLATRPRAPVTPIHTIGLCADAQCSNIKRDELRSLGKETFAFSAAGSEDQLESLFQEIMDGLNSQLVAKANVYPREGENQAVLSVRFREGEAPLTATFSFFSPKDYDPPLAPVEIYITSAAYIKEEDVFRLALNITTIEAVGQVIVKAVDTNLGQRGGDHIFDPAAAAEIEIKPEGFEAGNQYVFKVFAVDKDRNYIRSNKEDGDPLVLAETSELTYEPPQIAPVEFKVNSVNPNLETKKLIIDLALLRGADQVSTYKGYLLDEVTGNKVGNDFDDVFSGNVIEIDLPQEILQAQAERGYLLNLSLITPDKQEIGTDPYKFKVIPLEPPGLLAQIATAVQNPAISVSIIIIILCVVAVVIYWNRPARKESLPSPLPRPPIDQTLMSQPGVEVSQPRLPRLRLKVLQSPTSSAEKEKLITTFPFVIGRDGCDFNIPDQRISRRHAEITVRDGKFFVTDLESRNGTFIGTTKLPPHTPTPLNGSTVVRLGQQTQIELEPQ